MEPILVTQIVQLSPLLLVADIKRSIEFYTKKLGFTFDFLYDDFYAGVIKDGHSIHFKTGTTSTEERLKRRKNEDLDLVLSVYNIDNIYEELSNNSVTFIQPLRTMPYGREFYVADPDGYIIGFVEGVGTV